MYKCFWGVVTSHPSCEHPELGQFVHTVGIASDHWETSSLISIVSPPVYILTSSHHGYLLPTSSKLLVASTVLTEGRWNLKTTFFISLKASRVTIFPYVFTGCLFHIVKTSIHFSCLCSFIIFLLIPCQTLS